ncbi:MAG: LuxR C-terminal-related transcriptional regulator, partial [Planctomycetota bacterium]
FIARTVDRVSAMKSGAMNLIEKPFNPQELWDAVQEGLRLDALALEKETKRAACQDLIDNLTESEHRVMLLLSDGNANKVIASRLGVSLRTVEGRRASIFQKLHVDSIAGMMTVYLATKDE